MFFTSWGMVGIPAREIKLESLVMARGETGVVLEGKSLSQPDSRVDQSSA